MRKHFVTVILSSVLQFAMSSNVALNSDQTVAAVHIDRDRQTASIDCCASCESALFVIASKRVNGVDIQPPPRGNLEMCVATDYCYTDDNVHGCGTYEFQNNAYTFERGPLQSWNNGSSGEDGRSIRFSFKDDSQVSVEVVMQESTGCAPWPACYKH